MIKSALRRRAARLPAALCTQNCRSSCWRAPGGRLGRRYSISACSSWTTMHTRAFSPCSIHRQSRRPKPAPIEPEGALGHERCVRAASRWALAHRHDVSRFSNGLHSSQAGSAGQFSAIWASRDVMQDRAAITPVPMRPCGIVRSESRSFLVSDDTIREARRAPDEIEGAGEVERIVDRSQVIEVRRLREDCTKK